jgi:hypothetical protein
MIFQRFSSPRVSNWFLSPLHFVGVYSFTPAHTCELLAGKLDAKEPFGRRRLMWKDNIKVVIREIVCKGLSRRLAAGGNVGLYKNAKNVSTIIGFSVNLYQLKSRRLRAFNLRS